VAHVDTGNHFLFKLTDLSPLSLCKGLYSLDGKVKTLDNLGREFFLLIEGLGIVSKGGIALPADPFKNIFHALSKRLYVRL
jgi:hypothetical protein